MRCLIVLCSKSPNPHLYTNIENIYKYQISDKISYTICVIDSDSHSMDVYDRVRCNFPDVKLHFIKNKEYEYGAWKYAFETYPPYDMYICLQDSVVLQKQIPLRLSSVYIYKGLEGLSGYNSHISIKEAGIENLQSSGLSYLPYIHTNFCLAQHSCLVVSYKILKDIFKTLTIPPTNKDGSCFYERNFGLYFICKKIRTQNLEDYATKIHGNRN